MVDFVLNYSNYVCNFVCDFFGNGIGSEFKDFVLVLKVVIKGFV